MPKLTKKLEIMTEHNNPIRDKIFKGLDLTYARLIKYKKDRNLDMVVSKDGKVVRIPAKEFETKE